MSAPWFDLAGTFVGTREFAGKNSNPIILSWFEKSGHQWIKDDETAWCAAFANAMLELTGVKGTGSVAARSFLNWGVKLNSPRPGCIVVFKRGASSWQGHVAFFVRETGTHIVVRGGNQGNRVSEAPYRKTDFLDYRWPAGMGNSQAVAGIGAASFGTTGTVMADLSGQLEPLTYISEWAKIIFVGITILGIALAFFAKWDDAGRPSPWKRK